MRTIFLSFLALSSALATSRRGPDKARINQGKQGNITRKEKQNIQALDAFLKSAGDPKGMEGQFVVRKKSNKGSKLHK